jgi:hypothetical protein
MKKYFIAVLFFCIPLFAQELKENTSSFFDESELKEFILKNILVEGEVEMPGVVDLSTLPLRNVPIKELSMQNGKDKYIGTYYYSGYSLFDILNSQKVKKANGADFKPAVDLYVVVENDKGEKAVFSWGEIYYAKDNFQALISKSVNAVNPSKMKMKWPLPAEPRLVCGRDAYNFRFISNPVKITVKSFPGVFTAIESKEIFSPGIKVTFGSQSAFIEDTKSTTEKRTFKNIGYGHGMGWKGVKDVEGYVFKDVLKEHLQIPEKEIASSVVCVSAKDGYRATYSLSELINRSDNEDFLLCERKDSKEDGRYTFYASPDFFVDRNVRAAERIQIISVK